MRGKLKHVALKRKKELDAGPAIYLLPGWFSPLKYVRTRSKYLTYLYKSRHKRITPHKMRSKEAS